MIGSENPWRCQQAVIIGKLNISCGILEFSNWGDSELWAVSCPLLRVLRPASYSSQMWLFTQSFPNLFSVFSPLYCLYPFQLFITSGAFWSSRIIVAGEAISSSFNKPSRQTGNRSIRLSIFRPFQMLEQFRWITSNRKSLWVLISQEAGVMMNAWKQRQKLAFWKPKACLSVCSRDGSLNPHSSVESPRSS